MAAVRLSPALRLAWRVHRWLFRVSGGRIGRSSNGMPVLLLTTRGRRSGEPRDVTLQYLPVESAYVVIGSYAGEDRHPSWWLNLLSEPTADLLLAGSGSRIRVRAREAVGEERERLWRRIVATEPGYGEYEQRTTRRLPVVLLEPIQK